MKGIDISMHNGDIDFNAIRNDNVEVIIIKATEGVNYVDPHLNTHYNKAISAGGYKIGFYHFMSEKTDPAQQARDFYKAISDKSYQVLPILDIETNNRSRSCNEISNRVIEFLNEFERLSGIKCGIYTGGYFGRDLLDSRIKDNYYGWIAHYGVNEPMYTGFKIVCGHQYTEDGRISGINTRCDVNNFNEYILLGNNAVSNNQPIVDQNNNPIIQKIKELQSILKIEADGKWGPITDATVRGVVAGIPYKTPELTKWIQLRLGLNPDGIFYTKTEEAVKEWQRSHGLSVDGIAGYSTIKSLAFA